MKNKILLIISIVLMVVYINMGSKKDTSRIFLNESTSYQQEVVIKDLVNENYQTLDIEDYLVGVVAAEMPASFNYEALKAQAVAARTYAYHKIKTSLSDYDLTTDSSTQNYITIDDMKNKWNEDFEYYYNIIKSAVSDTKNEVITFNDEVISAYYFSMSNGITEDSKYAFGEDKSYLVSVDSYEDIHNKNYIVTSVFTKEEFCNLLNIDCNNGITINNIKESNSNRVTEITINNTVFSGTQVRYLLNLRSNDFTIYIQDSIYIYTCGYGHGVGMSQYGANNMANLGYSYKEILTHFYSGTKIQNITSII